jgi:hypothetical protein
MAHEPLDQHHRELPKQQPQERQADDRIRGSRHNGDAELTPRPFGAVVRQEAAGTRGSGNNGAGDWLRPGVVIPLVRSPLLILPACKALVTCALPDDVVPDGRQVLHPDPPNSRYRTLFFEFRLPPPFHLHTKLLRDASDLSPQAKGKSSSAASSPRTTTRSRAEKKVYSLAVQKFDPPEETVSLRILYDSLSKQIAMAEFWY